LTLYKWVLDDIRKLSYIKRVELGGGNALFFYDKDGIEKHKKLPLRANRDNVVNMLTNIRMDIHYDENKVVIRDAPQKPAFLIAGETYGEGHENRTSSNS